MDSKKVSPFLPQLPTAISGVALAIVSLGVAWESVLSSNGLTQLLTSLLSACIVVLLLAKFLFYPSLLVQDLQHPIASSTIPTIAMALMVLSSTLADYHLQAATLLSWLAITIHVFMFIYFVVYRCQRMQLQQFLPSWFIPPIGLALAVVTHPDGLPDLLAQVVLIFTFVSYAILLPIVLYRLKILPPLSNIEKPILVILATPASLLLLAYLVVVKDPNMLFISALLGLAVLMTLYAYLQLPMLIKLEFVPTYSALTFPLVVGALALFKTHALLQQTLWAELIHVLAYFELVVASVMVIYVLFCYIKQFIYKL